MTKLTINQIKQLNMYSVYTDSAERKIFSLETLFDPNKTEDALIAVQTISRSPNKTVAASYFMRRVGMYGKSLSERAKSLIDIAHPAFREELLFDAKKNGIL